MYDHFLISFCFYCPRLSASRRRARGPKPQAPTTIHPHRPEPQAPSFHHFDQRNANADHLRPSKEKCNHNEMKQYLLPMCASQRLFRILVITCFDTCANSLKLVVPRMFTAQLRKSQDKCMRGSLGCVQNHCFIQ